MKTEIVEVFSYSDNKPYQWVTCNGKTEIFSNRQQAITRGLELSAGTSCTFRVQ